MTRRIGPPRERRVADERADEGLARQHTGQHPHRRAGVAGVERLGWRTEAAEASSDDGQRPLRVDGDLDAEPTEARERRLAVGAGRVSGQARATVGQRRDQGVAMRDGLVARDAQAAVDAAGWCDGGGRHREDVGYQRRDA